MTNKVIAFILDKIPEIEAEAVKKIKELALSGIEKGEEKKAILDEHIIEFVNLAIDAYDIPLIPDALVDPALKKLIANYIPQITQRVFDTLIDSLSN